MRLILISRAAWSFQMVAVILELFHLVSIFVHSVQGHTMCILASQDQMICYFLVQYYLDTICH